MKATSIIVFFATLLVILLLFLSSITNGVSTNPCGSCHSGTVYSQYLDILEGDSANQIPSAIEVDETKTVSVIVENRGNPGAYSIISDVSLTLTSKNGYFSVNSPTYNAGDLPLGRTKATWQITGVSEGFDSLIITASGNNKQHSSLTFLFSDSYSPSPAITVGNPTPTPSTTPTPTPSPTSTPISPTPTPSQAPTTTPTPSPNITPTPPFTDPLSIVLTSPTEQLVAGTSYTIKWSTSGGTKPLSITIDYSIPDISGSWTPIATGIADNGSLTWKTPNVTATVYIRALVTDSSNPTQSAVITKNVEVNEPGAPILIIIPLAFSIAAVSILVLLGWKRHKKTLTKSEVHGK